MLGALWNRIRPWAGWNTSPFDAEPRAVTVLGPTKPRSDWIARRDLERIYGLVLQAEPSRPPRRYPHDESQPLVYERWHALADEVERVLGFDKAAR